MTVGGALDHHAGCESDTIVFRGQTTQDAQKLGELQPASSTPINENGTDVQDSESNSFDLTGISTSETNTYIFETFHVLHHRFMYQNVTARDEVYVFLLAVILFYKCKWFFKVS